jgi:hypothetical protein
MMLVDRWILWDVLACTYSSVCAASGGSDTKLHHLLPSRDMSVFDFHGEDDGRDVLTAEVLMVV